MSINYVTFDRHNDSDNGISYSLLEGNNGFLLTCIKEWFLV